MMRQMMGLLLLGCLLWGCHAQTRAEKGMLLVQVVPPQALVYVDDAPLRTEAQLALPAGVHRIEARAEGCFTAYREVLVTPGGQARLRIALRRDPDAPETP